MAEVLFSHAQGKPLTDELRNRLAARTSALKLETFSPCFESLEADPVHSSAYYLMVDTPTPASLLLHFTPASAPASGLFPHASLIGRMVIANRAEIVVNAIPFASHDHDNVRRFAEEVNPAFLPRPQGAQAAIAVGNRHPEVSLPAAFDAYRTLLKRSGLNLASTSQLSATREMTIDDALAARDGEDPTAAGHTRVSIRHLYHAGLWAAIRAGWREGYNAEADHFIVTGNTPDEIARSVEATKEAIRHAAGYTKFTTDTSRLFLLEADARHPAPWNDAAVEEKFDSLFSARERAWILGEFVRRFQVGERVYDFQPADARRLAVKFGKSLLLNEELYDFIRETKSASATGRAFDFEPID